MTFHSGTSLNFRCPYQAKVIKIFEPISNKMVHMVVSVSGDSIKKLGDKMQRACPSPKT
jgi:hypothetical protein